MERRQACGALLQLLCLGGLPSAPSVHAELTSLGLVGHPASLSLAAEGRAQLQLRHGETERCLGADGVFHQSCGHRETWRLRGHSSSGWALESASQPGKCLRRTRWKGSLGVAPCSATRRVQNWVLHPLQESHHSSSPGFARDEGQRWILAWSKSGGRQAFCLGLDKDDSLQLAAISYPPQASDPRLAQCTALRVAEFRRQTPGADHGLKLAWWSDTSPTTLERGRARPGSRPRKAAPGSNLHSPAAARGASRKRRTRGAPVRQAPAAEAWVEARTGLDLPLVLSANPGDGQSLEAPGLTRQELLGAGAYSKYMMPVYAVAWYAEVEAPAFAQSLAAWRTGASVPDDPDAEVLADDPSLFMALGTPAGYDRTLLVKMAMSLSAETMQGGMLSTWHLSSGHKKAILSAAQRHRDDCCTRGTELAFTWKGRTGEVEIRFNGKLVETLLDPAARTEASQARADPRGFVTPPASMRALEQEFARGLSLPRAFFYQFYAEDPALLMSLHAKRGFTARLPGLLSHFAPPPAAPPSLKVEDRRREDNLEQHSRRRQRAPRRQQKRPRKKHMAAVTEASSRNGTALNDGIQVDLPERIAAALYEALEPIHPQSWWIFASDEVLVLDLFTALSMLLTLLVMATAQLHRARERVTFRRMSWQKWLSRIRGDFDCPGTERRHVAADLVRRWWQQRRRSRRCPSAKDAAGTAHMPRSSSLSSLALSAVAVATLQSGSAAGAMSQAPRTPLATVHGH